MDSRLTKVISSGDSRMSEITLAVAKQCSIEIGGYSNPSSRRFVHERWGISPEYSADPTGLAAMMASVRHTDATLIILCCKQAGVSRMSDSTIRFIKDHSTYDPRVLAVSHRTRGYWGEVCGVHRAFVLYHINPTSQRAFVLWLENHNITSLYVTGDDIYTPMEPRLEQWISEAFKQNQVGSSLLSA